MKLKYNLCRKKWVYLIGSLLCVSLTGCEPKKETSTNNRMAFLRNEDVSEKATSAESYRIVKVSDGDTFWCEDTAGERIKVRLIGIDAPEPRNYFKKKKQPFGKEASAYATRLLFNKSVKLEMDINPLDQYGRTLAYAYLLDGTFINEKIVRDGYAILMTIQPNVKHVERLVAAQQYAKERQLGLWKKTND
ncbi:thermonuclease family protein [Sphingobacterium paludis]|uniref:Micrococcal nuclease n=1 Tax=Sphingobacterium paludis TaxID=1476465 RepID=A0A4R7CVB4_9SPHI|nr:thermonuclease family protein [Sphingobacterium paludis]TDS12349.1 micrococcal nuclease [Sphingobacterium paludis]